MAAVDACLGGVRRTVPQGMTLDLNFMSAPLDPRITFTRASTATYTDAGGTIRSAATNAPRWDYAGGVPRGLLIEEARTNMVTSSTGLMSPWSGGGTTLTVASGIAPDNTNTMTKLAEDGTNGLHYFTNNYTTVASVAYTLSVYAKAAGRPYLLVGFDDGVGSGATTTFDLSLGIFGSQAAGSGTIVGASMTSMGNGVYRCSTTGTVGTATLLRAFINPYNIYATAFFPSYQGIAGSGVLIWGTQLEQGAFPTSYVPTTSAAVTRTFDNCFIASANMAPWFASPGGTWFAEFIDNVPPAGGTSPRVIGIHNGTSITPLWVQAVNPELSSYDGGQLLTANAVSVGAISKGVSFWAAGAGRICLNGSAVVSGAMSGGFATLATAGVGILGGNPGTVNETMTGYIRRVQYWPRVLSNAEMQQVTT
jgi:hypothetical protein